MEILLLILLLLFIYFILGIHAADIGHPHALAIFLLNVFLGWTFVGWVIALVWAVIPVRPAQPGSSGTS